MRAARYATLATAVAAAGALSASLHAGSARAEVQSTTETEGSQLEAPVFPRETEDDSWFRSQNADVNTGNQRLQANDAKGALAAYDQAAKALPNEGGVHLDRGLALLALGELDKSRTALQLATQPPADKGTRASAYYTLGNTFFQEADALAGQEEHDQAQARFREAADMYKQALRLTPGQPDAAWNLELTQRRIQEEHDKAEQQANEDSDQQDSDQQGSQDGSPQGEDSPSQQDEPEDTSQPEESRDPGQDPGQDPQQQDSPQEPEQPKSGDESSPQQPPEGQPQEQAADDDGEQAPQALPAEVERALDALQDGEENLERVRALQRAQRERRRPEKDW